MVVEDLELTILMPCLNEAETLQLCIKKANQYLKENSVNGEVLIADNGSTDGSQHIATKEGARVIDVPIKGYGAAIIHGINSARGKYIIMGDSDDSYDFLKLNPYVDKLRDGFDLVMGNRFLGGIEKGAMPFLHKYLGNPVLSFIGRLFFKINIRDFHCGLRGFNKKSIKALNLQTTGMEFASEMVVKAALFKLKIGEVPTILSQDGRTRPPHLRTWRDGWRHLRFLLLFSPAWLFFYPGILTFVVGLLGVITLSMVSISIGDITLDIHTLLYSSFATIMGFQAILFYLLSRTFAINFNLTPESDVFNKLWNYFSLEIGLICGFVALMIGLGFSIYSILEWKKASFGFLDPVKQMRFTIPAVTIMILGIQLIFFSFFLSILGIKSVFVKTNSEQVFD
ncbi:MAG: glycosyltransferase [Opitutaceae bacterium]|nr:glycosyltransferase [Cytophagales bacterium]